MKNVLCSELNGFTEPQKCTVIQESAYRKHSAECNSSQFLCSAGWANACSSNENNGTTFTIAG